MVVAEHVNMFCILGPEGTTAGADEQRAIDRDGLRVRAEFPPWAAIGSVPDIEDRDQVRALEVHALRDSAKPLEAISRFNTLVTPESISRGSYQLFQ